jgi:hypothetical protein
MKFNTPGVVADKLDQAILITGSARSGTTIMGKLIHSLQRVEYTFEPPTLFPLMALIDHLDAQYWQLLFSTYLYEDFFSGAVAGRNLNFNSNDDSYIFNSKSESLVAKRMSKGIRKSEIGELTEDGIIAFKMPDIVPFIPKLKSYYKRMNIIVMRREPTETISSLLKKGWLDEKSLGHENRIFPLIEYHGSKIPYWVKEEDFALWQSLDEVNRCAYYCIRMDCANEQEALVIDYDRFVLNPHGTLIEICAKFNLEFGEKTDGLLETVKSSKRQSYFEVDQILSSFRDKLKI